MELWVALVTGAFGLVSLLVGTALELGTRERRARTAIAADLLLLEKAPEGGAANRALRARIEANLLDYASGSPGRRRTGRNWAALYAGGVVTATALGFVLALIANAVETEEGQQWIFFVFAAGLGISATVALEYSVSPEPMPRGASAPEATQQKE